MLKNFHTHTWRCGHAEEDERNYVETAIQGGLKVLGFADHVAMPPFADPEYYSRFRMKREQLPDYAETILQLKEEYKNDIEILLGFEAEYYPAMFQNMLKLLEPYPYDYLILGQHFLQNESDRRIPVSKPTEDPADLAIYVDQVIAGMETGAFSYLAHPDICRFDGDDEVYRREMGRLCDKALELDMPLECNLLGVRDNRHYPSERLFRLIAEKGNKVILGCDAHEAEWLNAPDNWNAGLAFLEKCGITHIVEDIRLRRK